MCLSESGRPTVSYTRPGSAAKNFGFTWRGFNRFLGNGNSKTHARCICRLAVPCLGSSSSRVVKARSCIFDKSNGSRPRKSVRFTASGAMTDAHDVVVTGVGFHHATWCNDRTDPIPGCCGGGNTNGHDEDCAEVLSYEEWHELHQLKIDARVAIERGMRDEGSEDHNARILAALAESDDLFL